jgi:signal transduction histidine kinase
MGGLVFCFVILALSLIASTTKLQSMNVRVLKDSQAIEVAHQIENAILRERREDLLWRATGESAFLTQKANLVKKLTPLVRELAGSDSSSGNSGGTSHIRQLFELYRAEALADPIHSLAEVSRSADRLLRAVEDFRERNHTQMTETLALSKRLNTMVDRWSIGLILFVLCFAALGAVLLLKRIIIPTFALSRVAERFGKGESAVRARVYNNDELGMLSRAFNEMTENIKLLEQDRRHFIASLAHDIRNPMVLIGGTARRLKKKQAVVEEKMPLLNCIIEQADAVEELIGELVDTVRLEDGNAAFSMAEVDLHDLLKTILSKQATMLSSHHLTYEGDPCRVWGDARRLERVVNNLISNAVKYSERGSAIDIRLRRERDRGVITVKDAGVGIPPEKITTLFQPFRRLAGTKNMAKGSGLGLFSVKKIIDGHGGKITIASEPGRGTTVTIGLPSHRNGCPLALPANFPKKFAG